VGWLGGRVVKGEGDVGADGDELNDRMVGGAGVGWG